MRMSTPISCRNSVMIGIVRYSRPPFQSLMTETKPTTGSHSSFKPKNSNSNKPSQNVGSDTSKVAAPIKARSGRRFCCHAAIMPAGTATSAASKTASTPICALTRKRLVTSCNTGSPGVIETPRSPRRAWQPQMRAQLKQTRRVSQITEQQLRRVARNEADEHKNGNRDNEQGGQGHEQAIERETKH